MRHIQPELTEELSKHFSDPTKFVVPPSDILDNFHKSVGDAWKKIEANYTQIHTLTALRDTLVAEIDEWRGAS